MNYWNSLIYCHPLHSSSYEWLRRRLKNYLHRHPLCHPLTWTFSLSVFQSYLETCMSHFFCSVLPHLYIELWDLSTKAGASFQRPMLSSLSLAWYALSFQVKNLRHQIGSRFTRYLHFGIDWPLFHCSHSLELTITLLLYLLSSHYWWILYLAEHSSTIKQAALLLWADLLPPQK